MVGIQRIQGVVEQLEVARRRVEGVDAQHPEDSRTTGGCRQKGERFGCAASRGFKEWEGN